MESVGDLTSEILEVGFLHLYFGHQEVMKSPSFQSFTSAGRPTGDICALGDEDSFIYFGIDIYL